MKSKQNLQSLHLILLLGSLYIGLFKNETYYNQRINPIPLLVASKKTKSLKNFIRSIICLISFSGGISMLSVVRSILGSRKSSCCLDDTTLIGISCVMVRELTFDDIECRSNSTVRHVDLRLVNFILAY